MTQGVTKTAPAAGFEQRGVFRVTPVSNYEKGRLAANVQAASWTYTGIVRTASVWVQALLQYVEVFAFDFAGVENAVKAHMIEVKAREWGLDRPTTMLRLGLTPVYISITQITIERIGNEETD